MTHCIALAEALDIEFETRLVRPGRLYAALAPRGPVGWKERPARAGSPVRPPFPDLVIATGRRTVPYLRLVRRLAGPACFTVFLKDPRCAPDFADFFWVHAHDRLRGPHVMVTQTAPHRFSPVRIARARAAPLEAIAGLSGRRCAVLVGGNSRRIRYTRRDTQVFCRELKRLADSGHALMVTFSRRTPAYLAQGVTQTVTSGRHLLWDGRGDNPILDYLAMADHIVVTADSTNMVGEALAMGRPVHVFAPRRTGRPVTAFLRPLQEAGAICPFPGPLSDSHPRPIDATGQIAEEIWMRMIARERKGQYENDTLPGSGASGSGASGSGASIRRV